MTLSTVVHSLARSPWGLDWIFPWACPACEQWADANDFCSCGRLLRRAEPSWSRVPLKHSQTSDSLLVYALWKYTPPARKLLHRIKYHREPYWMNAFLSMGECWLPGFEDYPVDVVCVPPRLLGWLARGFHLPDLLATQLAHRYSLRYRKNTLRRRVFSRPQVGLRKRERAENVKGQYQISRKRGLAGARILLVDDVMTTGSTLAECAEVLLEEGAASVTAWTLFQAVTGQTHK